MKPPPFDYAAPASLPEALALFAEHGAEAQPIAGGQSLAPMLALRLSRPSILIDLGRMAELKGVTEADGGLRIGAMTTQAEVIKSEKVGRVLPALAQANRLVGHFQTRNRGTVGGSISLGEPAAENPAFAVALDAELELRSSRSVRTVKASQFYTGPYMTVRADDELLTAITYRPAPGAMIGVDEIAARRGDFALAGLVASLEISNGRIAEARFAWFGLGYRPLRAGAAEAAAKGLAVTGLDIDALADLALQDTDPPDDGHATAAYRKEAGAALFRRLIPKLLAQGAR